MTEAARSRGEDAVFITEQTVPPLSDGPLRGWTVAVKDNIDVGGLRTTGGTRYLRDHVARSDAGVVDRVRRAGARVVGKANLHELGHGVTGVNPTFGTTVHPDAPERTVGGSSGGSALAVSVGRARVAIGTDTGGSVRIPAAYTGLVGFRPSTGRYPVSGVLRISRTRDTAGVIARTVADVIVVDGVLGRVSSEQPQPPAHRIGVIPEARAELSDSRARSFADALEMMRESGLQIVEIDVMRDLERYFALGIAVLRAETIAMIQDYLGPAEHGRTAAQLIEASESADVREILESALLDPVPDAVYRDALAELTAMHSSYRAALQERGVDVVAYPTVQGEPPLVEPAAEHTAQELCRMVLLSTPSTLAGTPAISLPAGVSRDTALPVGLTLEHLGRSDGTLLTLASGVERALGALR